MKCLIITFFLSLTLSSKLWATPPIDHLQSSPKVVAVVSPTGESSNQPKVESSSNSKSEELKVVVSNQETQQHAGVESLLGFKSWKEQRVLRARTNLSFFKAPKGEMNQEASPLSVKNVENSAEKVEIEKIQSNQAEKLRQLEFNLEIALGLTIHDYFSLYLKDKTKDEMAIVIPKLTPEELSTLLIAYRKSLYGLPIVEKENDKTLNQNL